MTERELPMGYVEEENSGVSLHLDWDGPRWAYSDEDWIDQKKLETLGFDCSVPLTDPSAALFYGKALPIPRYAVLEYEGDAWARWLARQEQEIEGFRAKVAEGRETAKALEERRERFARGRVNRSRLFLIDLGTDAGELRRRYADRSRYLIAAALVGLDYRPIVKPENGKEEPPHLQGHVQELLIETIHVPLDRRAPLDAMRREEVEEAAKGGESTGTWYRPPYSGPPRYRVTLTYGRRLEPWIADLARLP
jgi:hypothetical protein